MKEIEESRVRRVRERVRKESEEKKKGDEERKQQKEETKISKRDISTERKTIKPMKPNEGRSPNLSISTKPPPNRNEIIDLNNLDKATTFTMPSVAPLPSQPKVRRTKKPLKIDKFLYQVYGPKHKRKTDMRSEDMRKSHPAQSESLANQKSETLEFDNIFYS